MKNLNKFLFVVLILFSGVRQAQAEGSNARISLAGTGLGYSSVSGMYVNLGGIYEKAFTANWLAGLGLRLGYNSDWFSYGPQASLTYFFEDFSTDGFYLTSMAGYTWNNYSSSIKNDSHPLLAVGAGYQWVFDNGVYLGLGVMVQTVFESSIAGAMLDLGFNL